MGEMQSSRALLGSVVEGNLQYRSAACARSRWPSEAGGCLADDGCCRAAQAPKLERHPATTGTPSAAGLSLPASYSVLGIPYFRLLSHFLPYISSNIWTKAPLCAPRHLPQPPAKSSVNTTFSTTEESRAHATTTKTHAGRQLHRLAQGPAGNTFRHA